MHYLSTRLNTLYFFLQMCEMGLKERADAFNYKLGKIRGILREF